MSLLYHLSCLWIWKCNTGKFDLPPICCSDIEDLSSQCKYSNNVVPYYLQKSYISLFATCRGNKNTLKPTLQTSHTKPNTFFLFIPAFLATSEAAANIRAWFSRLKLLMLWMLLSLVAWECRDAAQAQRSISFQINLLNQKHYVDFLLNPSKKLEGDLLLQGL